MKLPVFVCCVLLACHTPRSAPGPVPVPVLPAVEVALEPLKLTIVGTNDVHGWVAGLTAPFPRGEIRYGGAATLAGYVRILRQDNPDGVVLVDAGDLFQGTLVSNLTEGSVVIEAFNQLGYDAAAIGNHEFDYGPIGPVSASTVTTLDPFGALKARIAQAKFPLLSTNIYQTSDGLRPSWLPTDGTLIIERAGLKIGLLGLTTPQTPTVTLPINVESLKFRPLASEALTAATRLRTQGADIVVAIVHAGGRCETTANPEDLSSCDLETGEIFEMMKGIPEGTLDAVIAGHTHGQIGHLVKGVPVLQSWALGRYFGVIELAIDPTTRKVLRERTRINSGIEICATWDVETKSCDPKQLQLRAEEVTPVVAKFRGRPIQVDEAVLRAMAPAEQSVAQLHQKKLGLTVPHHLGRNYENESPLGNLIVESMRAISKSDVALMNPGGIRADLKEGPLTYGAVYEVMPFDNTLAILELTGAQLERLLIAALNARKGVMQVSGLELKLSHCQMPHRLRSFTLSGGKKWDPTKKYKVALPDFLARGGDGLGPVLATIDPSQVDLAENKGTTLRDELIAFWQGHRESFKALKPGRVTFIDAKETCALPSATPNTAK